VAKSKIDWPADKVERRKIGDLIPYANNSRTHSAAQIIQIAASIKRFGFTVPVLIDPDGEIIAGHGRVLAARNLNLDEVPVMVARGWSAAQKKAYVIADNKLTLNGGWDKDILREEFAALQADDFDLGLTGFTPVEINRILGLDDIEPTVHATFQILITCDSEQAQLELLEAFQARGLNCKALIA
jgi:ParB-like chromosome segregation protein Spo0J